jgi:GT2 family glycosyltransferase/serine acetyltransferase
MKIAGILVNYQTSELTLDAVAALIIELRPMAGFHVYVVDNDSGDGSLERLRQGAIDRGWQAQVTVLAAPHNGGYGYGINLAARQALASGDPPDYLYVINTDAFADPGAIARMVEFMDTHPDVGMTGSRVYGLDGVTQGAAFRFPSVFSEFEQAAAFGLVSRLLRRHIVAMLPPATDQDVDWLPGTSMLIRRQVFDGGVFFDEGFFLYFEEVDFARELRRAGWRACYVADAPIKHIGSVSTGLAEQSRRLPDYWFDSRHRYFLKHHGRAYTAAADAAWIAGYLVFLLKRATLGRSDVLRRRLLRDFLRSTVRAFSAAAIPKSAPRAPAADEQVAASQLALARLLAEDFATCEYTPLDPGFWAVAAHRLGERAATMQSKPARLALQVGWKATSTAIDWAWKVNLPASVELGRRVRLHTGGGGMLLGARAIGNDVHIRHDTTFGPLRGDAESRDALPTIEDGVDIGSGVSILGAVTVGRAAVIAPNSVVLRDVPPQASVVGVPARARSAGTGRGTAG